MTRQIESDMAVNGDESHVANVGRLVEDMEFKMRNLLRMKIQSLRFPVTNIHDANHSSLLRGGLFRQSKGRCF